MFHVEYEHCFLFDTPQVSYVPAPFMDGFGVSEYVLMDGHTISDLPNNFGFEYDTGENWDFKCRIYKKEEKRTDVRRAILLEGAASGTLFFVIFLCDICPPKQKTLLFPQFPRRNSDCFQNSASPDANGVKLDFWELLCYNNSI